MSIQFNPNLPENDHLTPDEIESLSAERGHQTRMLAKKAYLISGVPIEQGIQASRTFGNDRQDSSSKKARKDARTWYEAKHGTHKDCGGDCTEFGGNSNG